MGATGAAVLREQLELQALQEQLELWELQELD